MPSKPQRRPSATVADLVAEFGDWYYVMTYAMSDCFTTDPGSQRVEGFTAADVAEVIHAAEGENDGDEWLLVVRLKDGRYGKVAAWCDYTGWGCKEGGRAYVAPTLPVIYRFGLTDGERARLGVALR